MYSTVRLKYVKTRTVLTYYIKLLLVIINIHNLLALFFTHSLINNYPNQV